MKKYLSFLLLTGLLFVLVPVQAMAASLTYQYSVATDYFQTPYNLSIQPGGTLYVVDLEANVKRFNSKDIIDLEWQLPLDFKALLSTSKHVSIATDSYQIYLTLKERQLVILNLKGQIVNHLTFDDLSWFCSLTIDPTTNSLLLADNSKLFRLDKQGTILNQNIHAELWQPLDLVVNSQGMIFAADTNHQAIQIFDPELQYLSSIDGANFQLQPFGLAVDHKDRLYVTNRLKPELYIFSSTGALLEVYSPDGSQLNHFSTPRGIDIAGDYLYLADSRNNRVQKYKIDHEALDYLEEAASNPASTE